MIIRGDDITGPVRESADVCIIGSGCGGGASAKILAEAGKKVIVLEEGGHYTAKDFDSTEETAYQKLYQQRAGQATDNLGVTVLQGKCVGGSSTINWTTTLRTPEFVLEAWKRDHGVEGLSPTELDPYFSRVESYLNVHPEPEENHNPNNRIILEGAKKLGYRAVAVGRNTKDCVKAGACGLGCPFDAKKTVAITYIPDAVKAGATVFANFRANAISVSGTAKRVGGLVYDQTTGRPKTDFVIKAPVVIISASAINSPVLLLKSGLANSSGEVGKHLTFHLTSAIIGLALPGFGSWHRQMMHLYPHIGATIVLVKEIDSRGDVTVNDEGRASISYAPGSKDLKYLKQALATAARVQFAAGAKKVVTLHTTPTEIAQPSDIDRKLAGADWGMNDLALFSAHPLGTCRMGANPRTSVVDSRCQSHDIKGLFVIDGSVTPTSLGVNPQLTILAIAEKSAEWIATEFAKFRE